MTSNVMDLCHFNCTGRTNDNSHPATRPEILTWIYLFRNPFTMRCLVDSFSEPIVPLLSFPPVLW